MSLTYDAPDVAKEKTKIALPIDLVGIQDLKIPILLDDKMMASSSVSLFVSLDDPHARGIHMSRMYLAVHEYFSKNTFKLSSLKEVLKKIMKDQDGLSKSSRICISLDLPVERKALESSVMGWRVYPFLIEANYSSEKEEFEFIVESKVTYSSTCPCSASLSRGIIKQEFEKKFSQQSENLNKKDVMNWFDNKESLSATPHAQKSTAKFKLKIDPKFIDDFSILKSIDEVEQALGTPVQTAVKRQDEAEFARRNAQNLMFCEDAIRKVALVFKNRKDILDYIATVQHYESLHPFTVESSIAKGVKQGWRA